MKAIIYIAAVVFYLYVAINMIIDIKDFGDFIWFVIVGSLLLAVLRFVLAAIVIAIGSDD